MRIKRLDCPLWLQNGYVCPSISKIEPHFNKDGYYLIGDTVVFEYNGMAWESKSESSVRAFKLELENAEYHDINILSMDQRRAILTLRKVGLATDAQMSTLSDDYSRRKLNLENYKWSKQ